MVIPGRQIWFDRPLGSLQGGDDSELLTSFLTVRSISVFCVTAITRRPGRVSTNAMPWIWHTYVRLRAIPNLCAHHYDVFSRERVCRSSDAEARNAYLARSIAFVSVSALALFHTQCSHRFNRCGLASWNKPGRRGAQTEDKDGAGDCERVVTDYAIEQVA